MAQCKLKKDDFRLLISNEDFFSFIDSVDRVYQHAVA